METNDGNLGLIIIDKFWYLQHIVPPPQYYHNEPPLASTLPVTFYNNPCSIPHLPHILHICMEHSPLPAVVNKT